MKERPILFSGPMVRAILAGTKTQTRRIARNVGLVHEGMAFTGVGNGTRPPDDRGAIIMPPYGIAGDRLWVRETWAGDDCCGFVYRADHPEADLARGDLDDGEQTIRHWRPSIFLPRAASRLTLDVLTVRVERLQAIANADIAAEGAVGRMHNDPNFGPMPVSTLDGKAYMSRRDLWAAGWDSINGKRAPWGSNPWVWVVSFKRVAEETES